MWGASPTFRGRTEVRPHMQPKVSGEMGQVGCHPLQYRHWHTGPTIPWSTAVGASLSEKAGGADQTDETDLNGYCNRTGDLLGAAPASRRQQKTKPLGLQGWSRCAETGSYEGQIRRFRSFRPFPHSVAVGDLPAPLNGSPTRTARSTACC